MLRETVVAVARIAQSEECRFRDRGARIDEAT